MNKIKLIGLITNQTKPTQKQEEENYSNITNTPTNQSENLPYLNRMCDHPIAELRPSVSAPDWLTARGGWTNLIGCGGISTGVSPQAGQLLLHAEVGALAHAEEGSGHRQRHQDEEHAEDGEHQELARLHPGLLHHGDLGQAAPLEDTHKQRERTHCQTGKKDVSLRWLMWCFLIYSKLCIKTAVHQFPPGASTALRVLPPLPLPPLSDPPPLISQL